MGAQATHRFRSGIISIFKGSLKALGWSSTTPIDIVIHNGIEVSLVSTPISTLQHWVRDGLRKSWIASVSKTRQELGGVANHSAGVDIQATTALLRSGKGIAIDPYKRMIVQHFITASLHTQVRMARAGLSCDTSTLCMYCGLEPGDIKHVVWKCPCWEKHRKTARHLIATYTGDLHPCLLFVGIALNDPEAVDIYNAQVLHAVQEYGHALGNADINGAAHTLVQRGDVLRLAFGTGGSADGLAHMLPMRAAAAVYFAEGHVANRAVAVAGYNQTAQRGEVLALLMCLRIAWMPLWWITDSEYAALQMIKILTNGGFLPLEATVDT